MITILISGPQGCGKMRIAKSIRKSLAFLGFKSFKIFTTNEAVDLGRANEE